MHSKDLAPTEHLNFDYSNSFKIRLLTVSHSNSSLCATTAKNRRELAQMNSFHGGKRKQPLLIDWDNLFTNTDDDHPPEIVITSSEKAKGGSGTKNEDFEFEGITDNELIKLISQKKRSILTLGHKLRDKGEKLKAYLRRCEAEMERRNKIQKNKGGVKCEETINLSDQSNVGAFAKLFTKKMGEDICSRTVNAFQEEMSFINPRQGKNSSQSGQLSSWGRCSQQTYSRSKPFQCPTAVVNTKKHKISKCDKKVNRSGGSATSSLSRFLSNSRDFLFKKPAPQDQPSTKSKPKLSSYHLVDEDIEEPDIHNSTPPAEKLSDCMKDVKVYYPSRDDRDPVEVIYTDMECLAPEACLSSTIMNFYIRYLQLRVASSSENTICNYHFFNTYFYNKLQKLNYREDSFLKFRKWWKCVNLFEKAYILLPIHDNAHWSLGIICIPSKEDELGPIVLHLDSLGLHDSKSIAENIKSFLKQEWSYLQKSEGPLNLPITDEIWKNLDDRIIVRKVLVPQQRNTYDCGLFVLFYMERFIKDAPERLTEKDLSMFGKQWFRPKEASDLRVRIHNLLVQEFKVAKEKETNMSPKC